MNPTPSNASALTDRERRLLDCLTAIFGPPVALERLRTALGALVRDLFPDDPARIQETDEALDGAFQAVGAAPTPQAIESLRLVVRKVAAGVLAQRAARVAAKTATDSSTEKRFGPFRIVLGRPPETRSDFPSVLAAAIRWKVGRNLAFFHRRNTEIARDTPVPFLLSEEFGVRFDDLARDLILPKMLALPAIRDLAKRHPWHSLDAETFWTVARHDGFEQDLLAAWSTIWQSMRLVPAWKGEGKDRRKVLKGTPELLAVRNRMEAGQPTFHLPRYGNEEIAVAAALLTPSFCRDTLDAAWPGVMGEFKRGAFDALAAGDGRGHAAQSRFSAFPEGAGEWLALLSHHFFPQAGIGFLDAFKEARGGHFLSEILDTPEAVRARAEEMDAKRRKAAEASTRDGGTDGSGHAHNADPHKVGWSGFSVTTAPGSLSGRGFGDPSGAAETAPIPPAAAPRLSEAREERVVPNSVSMMTPRSATPSRTLVAGQKPLPPSSLSTPPRR